MRRNSLRDRKFLGTVPHARISPLQNNPVLIPAVLKRTCNVLPVVVIDQCNVFDLV